MTPYFVVLGLAVLLATKGYTQTPDITSSWDTRAKPSIAEMGFDKDSIAGFIEKITGNDVLETRVGDFKWVDLDGDKIYELVSSVDYSGRGFFNNLYIIKQKGKAYDWQEVSVWDMDNLDGAIEDLDRDGSSELILRIPLSDYRGARIMPLWTAIYKWNGERFVDASSQFREFYQKRVLPNLETRIREITARITSSEFTEVDEENLSAAWLVKDKSARTLGDDPHAGVERAQAWLKSPNENIRSNALAVFEDIPDSYFKAELQMLAADPSPSIALRAKAALERLEKKNR